MTKPTESTEWASDPEALKNQDYPQRAFGWTKTNNSPTGVPVKPTMQNQNGWQNNCFTWIEWIQQGIPADYETVDVTVDLWRWDVGSYFNKISNGDAEVIINNLYPITTYLIWERNPRPQLGAGDQWVAFVAQTYFGSMSQEINDMIGRGIGIKIVDASDVIWTVFNTNGTGLLDSNLALKSGDPTSGDGNTRFLEFRIDAASTNISIRRDTAGVIDFPSDFTGFDELNSISFLAKNPDGIRAVLYGQQALDALVAFHSGAKAPKKIWKFNVNNSQVPQKQSPALEWFFDYEYGKRYRLTFTFPSTQVGGGNERSTVYLKDGNLLPVGSFSISPEKKFFTIDIEFSGPQNSDPDTKMVKLSGTPNFTILGGGGNSSFLYNVLGQGIMTIEELD